MSMRHKYNPDLTPLAKQLRREMTPEERRLWYGFLRTYPIRFQRQKVMGKYIADFYCSKAALVIEIDGSQHFEGDGPEKDRQRTAFLLGYGVDMLRFSNHDIRTSFDQVCDTIDAFIRRKLGDAFPG